jgi:hypothetical protein
MIVCPAKAALSVTMAVKLKEYSVSAGTSHAPQVMVSPDGGNWAEPVMTQLPKLTPGGRGSVSVTPLATTLPALLMTRVYVMVSPGPAMVGVTVLAMTRLYEQAAAGVVLKGL